MFKYINLQYLISYLGFIPFIIIIIDKIFLNEFSTYIVQDFIIYYSIIIFVFIGSTLWNLKENVSNYLVIYGFLPSFLSIFVILLHLYSYDVFLLLIIFFLLQLLLDNFIYKNAPGYQEYYNAMYNRYFYSKRICKHK